MCGRIHYCGPGCNYEDCFKLLIQSLYHFVGLLRFSNSSWDSDGSLCLSRNWSISSILPSTFTVFPYNSFYFYNFRSNVLSFIPDSSNLNLLLFFLNLSSEELPNLLIFLKNQLSILFCFFAFLYEFYLFFL